MTDNNFRTIPSPSPSARQSPTVLPPLSKFYYGPTQGWNSAEASPSLSGSSSRSCYAHALRADESDIGSTLSLHSPHPEIPPTLPPRLSPGLPAYSSPHWRNQFPPAEGESQGWQEHSFSPVNTGWDSRPTSSSMDTITWGVSHKQSRSEQGDNSFKPPLPPRPNRTEKQRQQGHSPKRQSSQSKYSPQNPSLRGSATTIDVPLLLQPQTLDLESVPPLPQRPPPPRDSSISDYVPPQPSEQPPPPPKLPLDHEDFALNNTSLQRLKQDPQYYYSGGHRKHNSENSLDSVGSSKKPRFDPQNSHDSYESKRRSPRKANQGPSIPMPQFSNFDIKTALSGPSGEDADTGEFESSERSKQNRASYTIQDRRSASTTDISSNRPAASTPESQQTSNTSYKDSEAQVEHKPLIEEGSGSFYWHSARSSSEGEDERSHETNTVTPGNSRETAQSAAEHEAHRLPTRSTSLSPVPPVTYGASALGLGGPSDWEYFGDYEAEEIDDEDLYIHKPRAELPTDYSQVDSLKSVSQRNLSKIEDPKRGRSSAEFRTQSPESLGQMTEDGIVLESKWSPSTTTPTTPHANPSQPVTVTTEPLPSEDQRPDLEEVIRAWSHAPHIGRSSSVHSADKFSQRHFNKDDNVAEASLASTPGENVLGIYAAPKDAPPIPKLPDTIDCLSATEAIEATAQVLENHAHTDAAKDDVKRKQNQDLENEMQIESLTTKEFKNVVPAFKSIDQIDRANTGISSDGSQAFKSTSDSEESKNAIMIKSDDILVTSSTFQKRQDEVADKVSVTLLSDSQIDSNQSKTQDRVSQVSGESIKVEENRPTTEVTTGHHHANTTMPSAISTKNDITMSSSGTVTDTSSTNQKNYESPMTAHDPSLDKPHLSGSILRIRTEGVSSPESDFARKRSMFESPSNAISCNTPIIRKPLKEIRQLAEPSISASGIDAHHSAITKAQIGVLDQREGFSQNPGDKNGPEKTSNTSNGLQNGDKVHKVTKAESSINNSDPTKASDPLIESENENGRSRSTTKEVEMRTSPSQRSEILLKDNSNQEPRRISAAVFEDSSSNEPENRTQMSNGALVGEQLAPEDRVDVASGDESQVAFKDNTPNTILHVVEGHKQSQQINHIQEASELVGAALPRLMNVQPLSETILLDQKPHSKEDAANDPYADLDPWGRASLNRFAAMLREEGRAESNKDKLNIFNVFASRESRLRVVLYGSEDELIIPQNSVGTSSGGTQESSSEKQKLRHLGKAGSMKRITQRSNTTKTKQSTKELPPLPSNRDSVVNSPIKPLDPLVVDSNSKPIASGGISSDLANSEQYSPGGQPLVQRPLRGSEDIGNSHLEETFKPSSPNGKGNGIFPIAKPADAIEVQNTVDEQNFPDARPRPNKSGSEVNNYLTNRRSIYRPFAAQTMESLENAISFGRESPSQIEEPPVPSLVAPTSQYNPANCEKGLVTEAPIKHEKMSENIVPNEPVDRRRFVDADFDPLVMVLPESEAALEESAQFADIQNVMEAVPDDFSFIHTSVLSWDTKVKTQREENDRQRHARQMESEQRIDSLFDDHEIGYGDIAELEGEFKRSEAAQKAGEDRYEYQLFVEDVFNLVWTRLHYELDQLIPHYERYSKLMDEALAGKEMFEQAGNAPALAPAMTAFLGLHQKLEIRHQKAFEAVLERDRRLKKTEISPWYTLSNIQKVKQLEKQFEDAEKNSIIEYCQQRNQRANRLMDVLDQNTLRGVGSNQDYMEAIMKAVRRIASGRAFASVSSPNGPTEGIELVQKAKSITSLLASSSEQIVQTFHVADMLLNSADYEVSVAKAKVTKADIAELAKLKEERTKEDQKLMRDLEHRLALIREDSRRTNDEIVKLMLFLGVHNGKAVNARSSPSTLGTQGQEATAGAEDADHQARMQKALEEAKKRNAEQGRHG